MIVVDTNVILEVVKAEPNTAVIDWLDRQPSDSLYLAATSLAEMLVGIEFLPPGQRRSNLKREMIELLEKLFGGRMLAFDEKAAGEYATIVSQARSKGRAVLVADGQIAAIASIRNFAVATRDVSPFLAAGVEVINPWEAA